MRGKKYDKSIDRFIQAAHELYPEAYIHLFLHSLFVYGSHYVSLSFYLNAAQPFHPNPPLELLLSFWYTHRYHNCSNASFDLILFHAKCFRREDFDLKNAKRILDKYRLGIACFNDDIQGTGCITLAAIMSGLHVIKLKLTEIRVVVFWSGTAGIGIADQIRDAITVETGHSKEEAVKQIW